MGTPIRPVITFDELFGEDYPERLTKIFGEIEKIKLSELSPSRAQALASEVVHACRSQLKYLRGFREFSEYFFSEPMKDNGYSRRTQDDKSRMYPLPEGFDGNTRCIVVNTKKNTWGAKPRARRHRGFIHRQVLLLDQDGDMYVWDWFARCESRQNERPQEIAIRSKIRRLVGKSLKKWLGHPENALRVFASLTDLVEVTVEQRQKQLDSMTKLDDFLSDVGKRLVVDIRSL